MNQPAQWRIKPLHDSDSPDGLEVSGEGITLGRDASNTVELNSEDFPSVSSHHARVVLRDDALVVEDLGSTNGTLVAGRRVERRELRHGDVFQLGANGPRFAALSSLGAATETAVLEGADSRGRSLGPDTIRLFRRELGISEGVGIEEVVGRKTQRNAVIGGALFVVLVATGIWGFFQLQGEERANLAELQALTQKLAEQIETEVERTTEAFENRLADQAAQWDGEREELLGEQQQLVAQISAVQKGDEATASSLQELQQKLEDNRKQLERFTQVDLEQERLNRVARVEPCVVLIEVVQTYWEEDTDAELCVDDTGTPNFDGEGEPVTLESNGSGFCVNDQGWIITNAHVVKEKEPEEPLRIGELTLHPRLAELNVIFSQTDTRHAARLVSWAANGDEDLALIKIEPFEGMPQLGGIDLNREMPSQLSEVYLLGFPLGKQALQEGERMIASTFRGILSRYVAPYLQVDAAVHPGNSGGPLVDSQGEVVGVVVGMQVGEPSDTSSAMGLIIPIRDAHKIWPPPISE